MPLWSAGSLMTDFDKWVPRPTSLPPKFMRIVQLLNGAPGIFYRNSTQLSNLTGKAKYLIFDKNTRQYLLTQKGKDYLSNHKVNIRVYDWLFSLEQTRLSVGEEWKSVYFFDPLEKIALKKKVSRSASQFRQKRKQMFTKSGIKRWMRNVPTKFNAVFGSIAEAVHEYYKDLDPMEKIGFYASLTPEEKYLLDKLLSPSRQFPTEKMLQMFIEKELKEDENK